MTPGGAAGPGPGAGPGGSGLIGPPVAVDTANADRCDYLDPSVCLYPFPNDRFTVPDPSMDTGRRLNLNILSMPRNVANEPINPADQNRNDGFSPGNLIVTKVPGLDTPSAFRATGAVPITDMERYADPAQPVVVIDAATGERHPIWSELDSNPSVKPRDVTLIIRPAVNFKEGHRYIVALRNLRDAGGRLLPARTEFRAYRDRLATTDATFEARRPAMEALFATLGSAGIARSDLYLAWDFTVASERNLSERMLSIRNRAFAELGDTTLGDLNPQGAAPAVTVDTVTENPYGPTGKIARRVEGKVKVPCYLNVTAAAPAPSCASGSRFSYQPGTNIPARTGEDLPLAARPTYDAGFTCQIPRKALTEGPGRPSLYGHGLLGSRGEIGQGQLKNLGGDFNMVFCATDWIGMACADLPDADPTDPTSYPGAVQNYFDQLAAGNAPALPNCDLPNIATLLGDLSNFSTLTDRVQQGMLNQMFLGRAMLHPNGLNAKPAFRAPITNTPVIDTDKKRLFYDGNSQGGIIGGSLIAVSPDLERGALGVPGMNYSTLLRRSVDFDTYAQIMYKAYPNELDRPLMLSLIQLLWDRAEANGYAQHMTSDPYPNTPAHRVLLHPAFGDHQVANVAAEVEARTVGAATIAPYVAPGRSPYVTDTPWGIPEIGAFPFEGSAIVMWDSGSPTPPTTNTPPREGADPHEHARRSPVARQQKSDFLKLNGKITNPCAPGPCIGVASDPVPTS
ncbi:MAG: hypothetical protein ACR2NH_01370 [Solirubrobacteraceae bacterium]